ncbi:hypothetical protein J3459_008373 [Metarhizium acridum]|nr:hypothetical protein J3459_008373 [Metarhizium acridum]
MPRKRKIQLACILLPRLGRCWHSITRLVLVIKGQWETDMPIFDKYVLKTTVHTESGNSKYNRSATSRRSRGTALSTFRLRSQHSMLSSQENTAAYGNEVHAISQHDSHSQTETDGIFVRVDFDVKEGQLETGHPGHNGKQPGGKYVQY